MKTTRLEAFSDGVLAIIITIMVLELKVPHATELTAIAYYILQRTIISNQGRKSLLAKAVGSDWKGKLSPVLYLIAIPLAFVSSWIAGGLYVFVALLWLIPDPRIERELEKREE